MHPKYKTPVGSIVFLSSVSLTIAVLSTLGVGNQEAYQMLQAGCGLAFALTYLVMFAIPLLTGKGSLFLRGAAVSGFLMTLLYAVFSIFPIVDVVDPVLFAVKIGAVVIALNAGGALLYWRATVRRGLAR